MKKLLLSLSIFCTGFSAFSQLEVGAGVSYNTFLVKGLGGVTGLHLMGEYGFDEGRLVLRPAFTYYLPQTAKGSVDVYNNNNNYNLPYAVLVPYTSKLNVAMLSIDAKRFFGEDASAIEGGFYAGAGVGYSMAKSTSTLGNYDHNNYSIQSTYTSGTNDSYHQFFLKGLVGYEKPLDFGVLFAEVSAAIPVNRGPANIYATGNIPGMLSIQVGYKYVFVKGEE